MDSYDKSTQFITESIKSLKECTSIIDDITDEIVYQNPEWESTIEKFKKLLFKQISTDKLQNAMFLISEQKRNNNEMLFVSEHLLGIKNNCGSQDFRSIYKEYLDHPVFFKMQDPHKCKTEGCQNVGNCFIQVKSSCIVQRLCVCSTDSYYEYCTNCLFSYIENCYGENLIKSIPLQCNYKCMSCKFILCPWDIRKGDFSVVGNSNTESDDSAINTIYKISKIVQNYTNQKPQSIRRRIKKSKSEAPQLTEIQSFPTTDISHSVHKIDNNNNNYNGEVKAHPVYEKFESFGPIHIENSGDCSIEQTTEVPVTPFFNC